MGSVSLDDKTRSARRGVAGLVYDGEFEIKSRVGDEVLQAMGQFSHLHKRNVEQAGFVVLKSPDIPSILVGTGFISNPVEAENSVHPNIRSKWHER